MMNLINFKTVVERWALDKRPYVLTEIIIKNFLQK